MIVAAMLIALALPPHAGAQYHRPRPVHRTCFDGSGSPCGAQCPQATCDADQRCDRICTFAFLGCGTIRCTEHTVTVPVGDHLRMEWVPSMGARATRYVLRCRHHRRRLPCPPASPAGAFLSEP